MKMIAARKSEETGVPGEQVKKEICIPHMVFFSMKGFIFLIMSADDFALLTTLLNSELRLLLAILYSAVRSFLHCYYWHFNFQIL